MGSNKASDLHKHKIQVMRFCISIGLEKKGIMKYFKQQELELGETNYTIIKNKATSLEHTKKYFETIDLATISAKYQEALETIDNLMKVLNNQIFQLNSVAAYVQTGTNLNDKNEKVPIIEKNENYDGHLISQMTTTLLRVVELRDDFWAGVPMTKTLIVKQKAQDDKMGALKHEIELLTAGIAAKEKKKKTTKQGLENKDAEEGKE